MSVKETERRLDAVRNVLAGKDIVELVTQNPKRVSSLLGFCETGDEITQLIARIFELFKGNEKLLGDVLEVISSVLSQYQKRTT
tara:strand:- start:73 stop:324 length:252 start_codon:yes stop_codon:yes gene_type:complete